MYYIIVFENLRFRPSTRTRENSVFEKFRLIVFIIYVWTEAVSVKKNLRFQLKKDTCGQGLKIWSFHAVVSQGLQRNVQKSVVHVQSCCFAH